MQCVHAATPRDIDIYSTRKRRFFRGVGAGGW